MAYYTGTADSALSLLSQIKALLPQQGWSVVRDDNVVGNNYGVILSGAGGYYRLAIPESTTAESTSTFPVLRVASEYSSGSLSGVMAQTTRYKNGAYSASYSPFVDFPLVDWHLFIGPISVYLVLQDSVGTYTHVAVGRLRLVGGMQGGWFASATWVRSVRASNRLEPYDRLALLASRLERGTYESYRTSNSCVVIENPDTGLLQAVFPGVANSATGGEGAWICQSESPIGVSGWITDYRHPDLNRLKASADARTGITRLFPLTIIMSGAQGRHRYIGEPPAFAVCLLDFVQPGQVLSIDGEDWMVFPRCRRDMSIPAHNIGYAYRVN